MNTVVKRAARRTLERLGKTQHVRGFASQPPLDQELPGMPQLTPATSRDAPKVEISTLSNGLRVASSNTPDQVTGLGVFVNGGSRYETDATSGVTHLLEHMAFKSTESRSHLRLVRDAEDIGAQVSAVIGREHMLYQGYVVRDQTETAMAIIAETILKPKLAAWDIDDQRKVIGYELEYLEENAQALLTEIIHAAAYTEQGPLGRPMWCPQRNLGKLGADDLRAYIDAHFTAPRMVLSGSGIEHAELVALAEKYFADLPASTTATPISTVSEYVGGDRRITTESPLTHVALAFDAQGWKGDNVLEFCALHTLLGGGGSFSPGGPGKGMYSRLYRNVLNKNGWVDSCTAFDSMYSDGGLIGIYGTSLPENAGNLVDVMANEMNLIASAKPDEEETARAKQSLKSSVFMGLESRQTLLDDIGRQIMVFGKYESPQDLCKRIDAVTAEGVQKAAQTALKSPVTVAAFGDVSAVPQYNAIQAKFK